MSRKDFQRDLSQAATAQFPYLSNIKAGDNDESITFRFSHCTENINIEFQAVISDSSDYPRSHIYFVFTTSDDIPKGITTAVESVQPLLEGASITKLLTTISQVVESTIYGEDSLLDSLEKVGSDDEVEYDYEDEDWEATSEGHALVPMESGPEARSMLCRDLRVAKDAGFRLGYLGIATGSVIVAVSCRVSKLGISEDTMQAWDVKPSEYLVLLLRYPSVYQNLDELLRNAGNRTPLLKMYVGLCASYKPSHEDAIRVFQGKAAEQRQGDGAAGIRPLFIDKAINSLLNERLLVITSYRLKLGLSWTGAELYAHRFQGKPSNVQGELLNEYFEPDNWSSATPDLLLADHVADSNRDQPRLSLPLLAMQFTLRHFVRCTEFCLVCHCRVSTDFEALKPYVCSNSLCLYQYMALGMGPSLEYEILSQPYVVDLLISLAYSRAKAGRLEDFPTGLGMKVPGGIGWIEQPNYNRYYNQPRQQPVAKPRPTSALYTAELDSSNLVLHLERADKVPPLKVGDWIAITNFERDKDTNGNNANANANNIYPYNYQVNKQPTGQGQWHSRVQTIDDLLIQLSSPINYGDLVSEPKIDNSRKGNKDNVQTVEFVIYDANFDNLDDNEKRGVIPLLLNTLPSVDAMTQYLSMTPDGGSLALWKDLISPAALDVLRWIVASNRSFIMLDGDDNPEHLIPDMDGYVQFRLVQGAPDKEHKFENAVKKYTNDSKHPSIFTWHGSDLCNWHSILREGLNFKYVAHGRSEGHGVYMAREFTTSTSYCSNVYGAYNNWSQSKLKISMVLSLNEVVNAPKQFVYSRRFYVVNQLDWIQPRYLFVQCQDAPPRSKAPGPSVVYEQDPALPAVGPSGQTLSLPASRIGGRGQQLLQMPKKTKRRRTKNNDPGPEPEPESELEPKPDTPLNGFTATKDDDIASVATLCEDLEILLSDVEHEEPVEVIPPTDFVPGTLDERTLPMLSHPAYATTTATKILQQHLKKTLEIQDKEYPGALGWYVDPRLISTVYQWIVELHSFDPDLPLAQDLKNADLKSIVLELRFPPQFPLSPPFIRVVRPRLLPFQSGGGGHVTAGGAMCMELLTNTGWLPTATIESVLLQVRLALMSQDPAPARLLSGCNLDYNAGEAVQAYRRACKVHGWGIPRGLTNVFGS
ncbi:putative ubiquitin conjugating enzyme [Aspergillus ruber CBS 135680]|uniref:UBC core domain-containing protein n=1 Tax=Aspergillus ruber (strain CBS 135680) TaxID=1388766 RepID=A0A017S365_ASPRC|nr:uncharacterized protein EURHEDRAFT_546969 [Aspergillus ruber CBS 135680]EYE91291.1 hypothetical protein EURHEDRAFT_546969 [Aspergillus ruber CBS 135680]